MHLTKEMLQRVTWFLLAGIILFGLQMRLQVILQTEVENPVRADAEKYVLYAYNLQHFNLYSYGNEGIKGHPEQLKADALVTPAYPLFLSLFIKNEFSKQSYYAVLLAQVFLSTLTILLSYFLFISLEKTWALIVSFLVACSPHLINMNTYLLTETLFCFFLILFLMLSSRLKDESPFYLFLITGIVLGLATLTRPWTQGFIFILCAFLALQLTKQRIIKPFIVFIGFALIIAPWMLRNYAVLGAVTDPTLSFNSILHGMYPNMMYNFIPESFGIPYRFDPWVTSYQGVVPPDKVLPELYKRVQENPWTYFQWYAWGKLTTVFSWSIIAGVGDVFVYPVLKTPFNEPNLLSLTHAFMEFIHIPLIILALSATILIWFSAFTQKFSKEFIFTGRLLALLIFYFTFLHIIGAPFPRYSIPIRPVLYGLAMIAILMLFNVVKVWKLKHE